MAFLTILLGCESPSHTERPLAKAADQSSSPRAITPPCIRPGHAELIGTVQREIQLGPPGYGETPATDRRDTIAVLMLEREIVMCDDSTGAPSDARAKRVALRVVPRDILVLQGQRVTAFGVLTEAGFAWEYGPLVMRVDSIPALRLIRRLKSANSAA